MRRVPILFSLAALSLAATGCSSFSPKTQPVIYAAGEKAKVANLVYGVTDAEIAQQLGTDPKTARTAQQRFYIVKVSVSNSGSDDQPIPAMTLVGDDGQTYNELADGTGVSNWLGVARKVAAAQTEEGNIVFDAPLKHYRLRLTDPDDEKEISIDIPSSFVREMGSFETPPEKN